MKKIFLLMCLCTVAIVNAQVAYPDAPQEEQGQKTDKNDEEEAENPFKDYFRLYYVNPSGIGDNVMAKANNGTGGLGLGVSLYNFEKVAIITGVEWTYYDITDVSRAANAENTNLTTISVGGEYKLPIGKHFCLAPSLCYAYSVMKQRTDKQKYGKYEGNGIRLGFTFDYIIGRTAKLFVGANLVHSWYDVNTAPQYEDYYRKVNTINLMAGIKL